MTPNSQIRADELTQVITKLRDRIRLECLKIGENTNVTSQEITTFKKSLIHSLKRLNKYEKELELIQ